MEIVIVVCLFMVIILLLSEKIVIKKYMNKKEEISESQSEIPEIMGQAKPVTSQSVPNTATESQIAEPEINPDNLDIEYDENEEVGIQIPQEELDGVFGEVPDLAEEEETLKRYRASDNDYGFSTGVTFEELSNVGALLQKEKLEPEQKETAVAIVQKLQETELFDLLESSMEGASRKIAELLDSTLTTENQDHSSDLRNNDLNDFDIEAFL